MLRVLVDTAIHLIKEYGNIMTSIDNKLKKSELPGHRVGQCILICPDDLDIMVNKAIFAWTMASLSRAIPWRQISEKARRSLIGKLSPSLGIRDIFLYVA